MTAPSFGAGRGEPYGRMLAAPETGSLSLQVAHDASHRLRIDVGEWVRTASAADLSTLASAQAPVLDVGCGPGRMVRASAALGLAALGIDIAAHAVARTRIDGSLALTRSVFDPLPLEGQWNTILLIDGNVGIGGDPVALFERCRELLAPGGAVVIEVDPEPTLDVRSLFTVADDAGNESDPFPWARLGADAVRSSAADAGLEPNGSWCVDGRHFVRALAAASARVPRETASATITTTATIAHAIASASA